MSESAMKNNQPTTQAVHWGFWCGVAFFVVVIVSLFWVAANLFHQMQQDETAPLTELVIEGENPYTTRKDVETAIASINLTNFFNVDVNKVQQKIKQLPWVYSVSVRKQWPNQLMIYLVDQTPVAMWNDDFILNSQGESFQADTTRLKQPLPQLFGPGGSEQTALKNYNDLNRLLAFEKLEIGELVLSERFSWLLTLTNGITMNLGRENRFDRVQRFLDVYQEINRQKDQNLQIDTVDLRYDTGLAVAWKKVSTTRV